MVTNLAARSSRANPEPASTTKNSASLHSASMYSWKRSFGILGIDPASQIIHCQNDRRPRWRCRRQRDVQSRRFYPKTAKLLATIDVSGTIFDPEGLDLEIIMANSLKNPNPCVSIRLKSCNEGGFLLDTLTKREQTAYAQQTLCWRKVKWEARRRLALWQ